jgi:hypothetical protein
MRFGTRWCASNYDRFLANAAAYGTQPVVAAGAAELMVDQSTGIDNYSSGCSV